MIEVKINFDKEKGHTSITVEGHGQDIVCSAVSALTQTTALGLEKIAEAYPDQIKIIKGED